MERASIGDLFCVNHTCHAHLEDGHGTQTHGTQTLQETAGHDLFLELKLTGAPPLLS
jgi:hypothetical protein